MNRFLNKTASLQTKIGFLGVGNMGGALISGALNSGIVRANHVIAYDLKKELLSSLAEKYRVKVALSSGEVVKKSDYVFLCVKPQQMKDLLLEIRSVVNPKQCMVSIAAGISIRSIENYFSISVPVIRVMPNTPALIQTGMAAIARGSFATSQQIQFAAKFFSSVGEALVLEEKYFDAVTALSGSGPAYLFYLTESLERAGQKLGLKKSAAELLSRQTMLGAAKMMMRSFSPRELRKKVTSPGGTTESAIRYLEKKKWPEIFQRAVEQARDRSKALSLSY